MRKGSSPQRAHPLDQDGCQLLSISPLRITPELLSMTRDEALPDSYSAQGFYENYEPKEILGR